MADVIVCTLGRRRRPWIRQDSCQRTASSGSWARVKLQTVSSSKPTSSAAPSSVPTLLASDFLAPQITMLASVVHVPRSVLQDSRQERHHTPLRLIAWMIPLATFQKSSVLRSCTPVQKIFQAFETSIQEVSIPCAIGAVMFSSLFAGTWNKRDCFGHLLAATVFLHISVMVVRLLLCSHICVKKFLKALKTFYQSVHKLVAAWSVSVVDPVPGRCFELITS